MRKIMFIILDGLGDKPCKELGGKTPLEAAETPNLDRLAREGVCGSVRISDKPPESDEGHLALFGYSLKKHYPGRGPIEAAGVGLTLQRGDVAFRANMATVDNGLVIDRRAGRIDTTAPFAKRANGMELEGIKFMVKAGNAHRMALVMRGPGLSDKITNTDPHEEGKPVAACEALDGSDNAKLTARLLNEFLSKTHKIFDEMPENQERIVRKMKPANQILTRGAGYYKPIPSFKNKYKLKACCVTGGGLYLGLGRLMGMKPMEAIGATGDAKTDIQCKLTTAMKGLKQYDFAYVHIKGTDLFGHDGDPNGKRRFIEKVDRSMPVLQFFDGVVVVTADHSTSCAAKDHSADPVPIVISRGSERDSVSRFSESACALGRLGRMDVRDVMPTVLRLATTH